MKKCTWVGLCALLLSLSACGGDSAEATASLGAYSNTRDVVQVASGQISAAADSSSAMRIFKGIPFAAPPVGALRWKAPQPVAPWTGVRRSDTFGAACIAGNRPSGRVGAILYQNSEAQSEDCLYLNVWTGAATASQEKRPVMMLLYGGGNLLGSGSQPNYDGSGLATKGAVVVTMNYRLGALGFLAHPELTAEAGRSANYALLDAIAALKWIQANIANFGGDPSRVTLYTESAGAGLANVLHASPKAAGLFHRLVIESLGSMPSTAPNTTLAQAEAAGTALGTTVGAPSLAALRGKPAQELMAATFAPAVIVDGDVLPDQLDLLFARKQVNDVPLLVGWNADEGTPYPPFATTLAGYETAANARYGAMAAQFKAVYPATTDAEVLAMAYKPMRDSLFAWQPWTIARANAAINRSPTYLYFFTRKPPYFPDQHFTERDPPSLYGAYHSLEQVYFYNNLDRSAPARPYTEVDRQIAATASSYLVNFAATGNPNGGILPRWPEFTGPSSQTMEIGDSIGPMAVPFRPALDFFDAFYGQSLGRPLPF